MRRLLTLLFLGNTAMYAVYLGVGGPLVQSMIASIDPASKVANAGLVAGVSAIFATLFNPLGGALSDRTRSRFGRRHPWLIGGAVAAFAGLALLAQSTTIAMVLITWSLAQAMMNLYQAALTAIVPDRIDRAKRGTASAIVGIATSVGAVVGTQVAAAYVGERAGFYLLGAGVVAAAVLIALLTHDPAPAAPGPPAPTAGSPDFSAAAADGSPAAARLLGAAAQRLSASTSGSPDFPAAAAGSPPAATASVAPQALSAAGGVVRSNPLAHHDFRWVFIGRALMVLSYFMVFLFQLYILQDHIKVADAAQGVATLTLINTACAFVSTLVSGPLADRLGRYRVFVLIAGTIGGLALLLPLISPTWPMMLVFTAVQGAAFGVYMAVDTALVTLVLPHQENAARDMGVLNIANAGPQIAGPFAASAVIQIGGYRALFVVGAAIAVLAAITVLKVRSVR